MLYRDISLVSIFGLHGTLYVQRVGDAEGVSVQTEGPYETKVVADTWLMIYPEDQEPQFPHRFHADIATGHTHVGSVDIAAKVRFLTDSRPPMRARTEVGLVRLRDVVEADRAVHGVRIDEYAWPVAARATGHTRELRLRTAGRSR